VQNCSSLTQKRFLLDSDRTLPDVSPNPCWIQNFLSMDSELIPCLNQKFSSDGGVHSLFQGQAHLPSNYDYLRKIGPAEQRLVRIRVTIKLWLPVD
jgi:hypothetical protein